MTHPVLPGCYPDPSVCRVGEDFYLVSSSFGYHPGLPVHRSRDLREWELVGHAMTGESWLDLTGFGVSFGVWAPTVRFHEGRFYVVVTVAGDNGSGGLDATAVAGTYLLTAPDVTGPWSAPHRLEAEGIDPDIFFDGDGRAWVCATRDSQTPGRGPGEFWTRELDLATLDLVGPTHVLWHGALAGAWVEAPHVYLHEGRYHLIGAEGGTERNHSVTLAVADAVTGPYRTDPRSPLLTHRHLGEGDPIQNVGHADLVEGPDGAWSALVLAVRPVQGHHTLGRETFLVPAAWDERGLLLAPGVGKVLGEPVAPPRPGRTDWVSLRGPVEHRIVDSGSAGREYGQDAGVPDVELAPRPGALAERGVPAFLGRRQQDHTFAFSTRLDVADLVGREALDAGITAFQDESAHLTLRVRRGSTGLAGLAVLRTGGVETELARVPLPLGDLGEGSLGLAIRSDGTSYTASIEVQGGAGEAGDAGDVVEGAAGWRDLATVPHSALSTETTGSFVGVVLGLVHQAPADAAPLRFGAVAYRPA
ncbi:glycoside hydrolase family 43 protein [Miniimonas sp. S16]|uniref:glycoside hydrolase family 43 protein n=1 Tax=Miniimonas sp. S16 TaxID=2171623 RepID=UPI001F347C3F|nr:glycoside hydrolase family 43 protein [Miniimonas sp. S16]